MVKFAIVCDLFDCKSRSPEYITWPDCTECHLHFCPDHGKILDEENNIGLCISCIEEDYDT